MKQKPLFTRFVNVVNGYSIWVVFGTLSTFIFYSRIFTSTSNYYTAVVLTICMWIIYSLDHIIDALKLKENAITYRHQVHYRNRRTILIIAAVLSVIACYLVYDQLPVEYIPIGIVLAAFTGMHFLINQLVSRELKSKVFLKEFFIAFVVTLGFVYLPLSNSVAKHNLLLFTTVFCINSANLLMFSYYDRDIDNQQNFLSASHIYGARKTKLLVYLFLLVSIVLTIVVKAPLVVKFLLILQSISLGLLLYHESTFEKNGLYRFWGDFIYVIPAFVLPFL